MTEYDKAFENARVRVLGEQITAEGIGMLSEKTLHRILKLTFEPDQTRHEVPVLGSVADICRPDGIVEIQTRSLYRLVPKLEKFLSAYPVTVVYPLPYEKYMRWMDPATGEIGARRRSPKKCTVFDSVPEIFRLAPFFLLPGFALILMFLNVDEFRMLNGWDKSKKRGSTRVERIPNEIVSTLTLRTAEDYRAAFLPADLPAPFTVKEYARNTRQKPRWAYTALRMLASLSVVEKCGERGREYLYAPTPLCV